VFDTLLAQIPQERLRIECVHRAVRSQPRQHMTSQVVRGCDDMVARMSPAPRHSGATGTLGRSRTTTARADSQATCGARSVAVDALAVLAQHALGAELRRERA
jgi:hypothetical protein